MVATTYKDIDGKDRLTGDLDTNSLSQARLNQMEGQFGMFAADAIRWFDSIAFFHTRSSNLALQEQNTVKAYQNKMNALDNQLLYVKNQLQDKFNSAVANDIVQTAARGVRVSMSNILEKQKESAHNITQDIAIASGNVKMDKATYKSYQEQAQISRKANQRALTNELAESSIKLAADIIMMMAGGASGGAEGGGSSFGFGNFMTNLGQQVVGAQAKNALGGNNSGEGNGGMSFGQFFGQMAQDYIGSIWGS
jgi:hypothetical protein